ncbi:helix-turn-helix transcriptional regulator [Streptomyces sp. NPDC088141]|uniref:helix-turn-helix domain-containing protein n=2 Tax=unclassified Streptomyces TaxID=2593676 RepID=UPI00341FD51D
MCCSSTTYDASLLDFEAGHPHTPSIAISTREYRTVMNPLPGDLFARRLRQERERLGISQAELARRMAALLGSNVDSTAITRIEQQTRAVRLDEAVVAARALDVPLILLTSEDPVAECEAQLQQYRAELVLAQREWEKNRLEIQRLTRAIQVLTGDMEALSGDDLSPVSFDPVLREAIDARVPAEVESFGDDPAAHQDA